MVHTLDLDAYFARIGFHGPRDPTLATLQAIVLGHIRAIPFENLDLLLGKGIDLDLGAIESKLVHSGRGGYCFEQNTLLMNVLLTLGYAVTPISARVRLQREREFVPPRTHLFLVVTLGGERLLCDVGVGGLSPTAPLRLDTDEEQATPHEPRRMVREGDWGRGDQRDPRSLIFHQVKLGEEWKDVAEFTLEEMHPIDRELANWYTSAHPDSTFRSRLVVARATGSGRKTLLNRDFTVRDRDGGASTQTVESHEELLRILDEHFGLMFPRGTRFECPGLIW